jgi:hypothetical protein
LTDGTGSFLGYTYCVTYRAIALAASVLVLAGCGGGESGEPATTATTTPSPPPTTTAATEPREIEIVVEGGEPRGGIERPVIEKDERIVLVIRSDAGEEVHVHGYDVERPIAPGTPLRIPITASIPGRFEVELHHPDVLLAVLQVRP